MSNVGIHLHVTWTTKFREPVLTKEVRFQLFAHIQTYSQEVGVNLEKINGHVDHVHCLISLGKSQSVSEVVRLLKGEPSSWVNRNNLTPNHFQWATKYFARSVSPRDLNRIRAYIDNQEKHHA